MIISLADEFKVILISHSVSFDHINHQSTAFQNQKLQQQQQRRRKNECERCRVCVECTPKL